MVPVNQICTDLKISREITIELGFRNFLGALHQNVADQDSE